MPGAKLCLSLSFARRRVRVTDIKTGIYTCAPQSAELKLVIALPNPHMKTWTRALHMSPIVCTQREKEEKRKKEKKREKECGARERPSMQVRCPACAPPPKKKDMNEGAARAYELVFAACGKMRTVVK